MSKKIEYGYVAFMSCVVMALSLAYIVWTMTHFVYVYGTGEVTPLMHDNQVRFVWSVVLFGISSIVAAYYTYKASKK